MTTKNSVRQKLAANVKANPDDSFSKFALALEFLKEDDLKRARILFEDIYQNDPEYVGIYYHLGKLYERTDKTEEALKMYEEGMEVAENQNEQRTLKELKEAQATIQAELKGR